MKKYAHLDTNVQSRIINNSNSKIRSIDWVHIENVVISIQWNITQAKKKESNTDASYSTNFPKII
jgi:hypothetical protein